MIRKRRVFNIGGVNTDDHRWLENVEKAFIFNPAEIDMAIFPGGADVSPSLYNENKCSRTVCNPALDERHKKYFDAIIQHNANPENKQVLMIGICRGAQLLTALSGGRLIQHVTGHMMFNHNDEIRTSEGTIKIMGDHHQMMYPYDMEPDEYELLGWSKTRGSSTYLDGNDSEIIGMKLRKEAEIVYYPKTHCLCIQAHPEWGNLDYVTHKYLNMLVNDVIADKTPKNMVFV